MGCDKYDRQYSVNYSCKTWRIVGCTFLLLQFQKNFSVDVDHIPPSTYTVTGLNPSSFENDKHPFTDQSRDTKLDQETSSIEKGLQKLVLSSKPEKQRTEHPEKVQKKGTPCSSLVFLKDIDTNGISLFSTMNSEMTFPFQLCPITDYELVVFRGKETKKCCFRVQAVAQCLFKSCKYMFLWIE